MYNLTNATENANNIFEIADAVNKASGSLVAILFMFTLFLILFISLKKYENDTKKVLLTSSVIVSIIAVLLWTIGWIGFNVLIYPIIMLFAMIILNRFG